MLFIGESEENAVYYDAVHDCIWGRPPYTTREEGIWILHKILSVEDIINASASLRVNAQPELMRVWCDTSENQTKKGYIHLKNLPTQHSTPPPPSIPATPLSSETAINDNIIVRNNSAIVSYYHKQLLLLSVIIVIGVN